MAKCIALITKATNDSLDYALSSEGKLYTREGYFDNYRRYWTKTKWTSCNIEGMHQKYYLGIIASMLFSEKHHRYASGQTAIILRGKDVSRNRLPD